jgi:carboxyl-terminal processing protease
MTVVLTANGQNQEFEIAKNLDIYATLFKQLNRNYVDEIKPGELNETAIKAMLESLDPYTVFINESELEDYKFMTTGQYGGIGALIQKRDDFIIISEPYEGFPADKAGLQPGDKIFKVDQKQVKGKPTEQVSELLKGEPGTTFQITIIRPGTLDTLTKNITREKIKIEEVPYYGYVDNQIGYINLRTFTKDCSQTVKNAFLDMQKQDTLSGLILDLRNNGGGLLDEAVRIMDFFVEKGEVIVTTKGKLFDKNHTYRTSQPPIDANIPIVVLINSNSASASEIVSGAMQDLDRGVLVGERTFGKGLVQNILPLSYQTKAKITVAKYYIPSGRCIQEIDYSNKNGGDEFEKVPDSLIKTFRTKNGRSVTDAKGIHPDIEVRPKEPSRVAITLYRKNLVFDFATRFKQQHDTIEPAGTFVITDEIYDDFLAFLSDKEFEYTTETEKVLDMLKTTSQKEGYFQWIEPIYDSLRNEMLSHKKNDLKNFQDEIRRYLRAEIVTRYYHQRGGIETSLKDDVQVRKAIEILNNKTFYRSILDGTYTPEGE